MILPSFKPLFDLLVALATERRRSAEVEFEHYYEPCYVAAKAVFEDYSLLFQEVRRMLKGGSPFIEIAEFMGERRCTTFSYRRELRGWIESTAGDGDLSDFENAINGIMSGVVEGHPLDNFIGTLGGLHTVNERRKLQGAPLLDNADLRNRLLATMDRQITHLRDSFANVARHYTKARKALLPKDAMPRMRRRNLHN